MRSIHKRSAALIVTGLALLMLLLPGLVRADDAGAPITAAGTQVPMLYLPFTARNTCSAVMPAPGDWLAYVNYYRALACLPAVTENATYSDGDRKHAKYMVKNDYIGHSENASLPYYTPEGAAAAAASNVMATSDANATDNYAIDLWMKGPFHAVGILDPKLQQAGFGSYREADGGWQMAAALNVISGLGSVPSSVAFPVKWPTDGMTVNLKSYDGNESPDPLTSCSGYTAPSGLPIILQLGTGNAIAFGGLSPVSAFSFKQGATTLPSCEFDENNYQNPDASLQSLGRAVLDSRDAIVIVPKTPLTPGATYTVSVTANAQTYTWSFTVSASATALEVGPEALIR
jgi:hypothetical protein